MSNRLIAPTQESANSGATAALGLLNGLGDIRSASCLAALSALPGVVIYQRVVTPDEQIRYTYISEGCIDIFGVSAQQILSDPEALFSCHGEDYKAKFRERLLAASNRLSTWDVEASIVSQDGRKKYTHAIARPEQQPDGSVLWTGIILDETRTREAVFEGLSQGFVLYDADGRLVMRNSHFLEIYPALQSVAVPGARYEDVLKAEVTHARSASGIDPDAEFALRMERHREPRSMFERQTGDDRWVLINENRTSDGGTVVLYTDVSELKRREREIQFLADHDILTGIYNRSAFQRRAEEALLAAKKQGATAAILCLDVDHFKHVNDFLGHLAGDRYLKSVARHLNELVRSEDTVARFGGDEFGIVLRDVKSPQNVANLASRILEVLGRPVDFNGQQIVSSVSIGIALSTEDGDYGKLIQNADLALYRAKADGRSTFRFFEENMDTLAQARRALETDLRHAVDKNEMELNYQAQIDIFSDQIVGFEALLRWRHPQRGLVPPQDFIPVAEETGLIGDLGEWVLRQACTDALAWSSDIKVAVNVSPAQFKNRNLSQTVAKILEDTGLPPERLELEITESVLLHDVEDNLIVLRSLKALGVRISMDDFGTGYSCLGSLRCFPFDKIKIDRSFVGDLEKNPDAAAIIHAVLGLGHSLGMSTCAEGVETKEQLMFLRGEGCSEVQGYLYSRPRPAGQIVALLKDAAPEGSEELQKAS
jgi:diguanylate cyclase (GGDEF)-like protein